MKKHLTFVLLLLFVSLVRAADGSSINTEIHTFSGKSLIEQSKQISSLRHLPALATIKNTSLLLCLNSFAVKPYINTEPTLKRMMLSFPILGERNEQAFYELMIKCRWLV